MWLTERSNPVTISSHRKVGRLPQPTRSANDWRYLACYAIGRIHWISTDTICVFVVQRLWNEWYVVIRSQPTKHWQLSHLFSSCLPCIGQTVHHNNMGNDLDHVLHVHALRVVRKWTVQAIETTGFVIWLWTSFHGGLPNAVCRNDTSAVQHGSHRFC